MDNPVLINWYSVGNPFILLRLGQTYFELGNMKKAADELVRAYMGVGTEIFEGEDPKYFDLVRASTYPGRQSTGRVLMFAA